MLNSNPNFVLMLNDVFIKIRKHPKTFTSNVTLTANVMSCHVVMCINIKMHSKTLSSNLTLYANVMLKQIEVRKNIEINGVTSDSNVKSRRYQSITNLVLQLSKGKCRLVYCAYQKFWYAFFEEGYRTTWWWPSLGLMCPFSKR